MFENHLILRDSCTYSTSSCQSAFILLINLKQMCYYTSVNIKQTQKPNRQIAEYLIQNIWQWQSTPDAFILYFFHAAVSFDDAWTETFLKHMSEKVFSDESALLQNSGVGWQKTQSKPTFTKVTFSAFCKCYALFWSCREDLMSLLPTTHKALDFERYIHTALSVWSLINWIAIT